MDEDLRAKWVTAFDRREETCEKLGALHLLAHGIYAFKVDGKGAGTDLVMNDHLSSALAHNVDALVATEWKLVRNGAKADTLVEQERDQLRRYVSGPLGDVELRHTRYILVGSK